ncbi:hypothetical protein B7494_g1228 [Chlorociboria aeruginascens]|nr:hypothetical protein B7494_g1228 [Chlorociboria aeruginascens]
MATPESPPPNQRFYFAYGSNLSLSQMARRCPVSVCLGLAQLHDYKWIIGERGYANVVPAPGDQVWGLLFSLEAVDERKLDGDEGVSHNFYEKKMLEVDFIRSGVDLGGGVQGGEVSKIEALVYVDTRRKKEGTIKEEYIGRMEMGIEDALQRGMPVEYVDKIMRRWWVKVEAEGSEKRNLSVRNP